MNEERKSKLETILKNEDSKVFAVIEPLKAVLSDNPDIDCIYEARGYISVEMDNEYRIVSLFDDADELYILAKDHLGVEI